MKTNRYLNIFFVFFTELFLYFELNSLSDKTVIFAQVIYVDKQHFYRTFSISHIVIAVLSRLKKFKSRQNKIIGKCKKDHLTVLIRAFKMLGLFLH